jgi:hypothetical protein
VNAVPAELIKIELANRFDAIDLAGRLDGYSLYFVQLSDARWFVCVRQDREFDRLVQEIRDTAIEWASDRSARAVIRFGDQTLELVPAA